MLRLSAFNEDETYLLNYLLSVSMPIYINILQSL